MLSRKGNAEQKRQRCKGMYQSFSFWKDRTDSVVTLKSPNCQQNAGIVAEMQPQGRTQVHANMCWQSVSNQELNRNDRTHAIFEAICDAPLIGSNQLDDGSSVVSADKTAS
jgi:hypothetical protein